MLLIESFENFPSSSLFSYLQKNPTNISTRKRKMGRLFLVNLEGKIYSCKHCKTQLALCDDIVSKSFHCRHGKAYLFSKVNWIILSLNLMVCPLALLYRLYRLHTIAVWNLDSNTLKFYRANVTLGPMEDRLMMTGLHTVADIFCVKCGSVVGWTYETAHEKNQKYKEGKSVLERFKLSGPDGSNYWVNHETHISRSEQEEV